MRGGQPAPQYTCEHIWWTTHGLAWPCIQPAWPLYWHRMDRVRKLEKRGPGKIGQAEALVMLVMLVADLPQLGTVIGGAGLEEEEKQK